MPVRVYHISDIYSANVLEDNVSFFSQIGMLFGVIPIKILGTLLF